MKEIDLNPQEWKSEREKPHEPFFGEGLSSAIYYVIGFAITFSVMYFLKH